MPLTDTECRKAQPKEKQYRLSDSHGLSLIITTKGQKYWNVRVTVHGERKSESLGPYPDLSLKKARELAYELKHRYSRSVLHEDLKPYFKEVAEDWFNNQKETWSSKHISNVRASLDELYIALANKRINQIQAPEILQIIKKIEARGSLEIAKRTLSRCGMVMKYAIAHGYRYDNPAGDLVYALKNKRVKNLASLPESEMPEFLKKVRAYPADAQTHHAIILIMLTGVRVSELLQAQWEEFDLEGRKWDIPEERMKNRLPHRVRECVENDTPPSVDASESAAKALQQLYPEHVPLTVEDLSQDDTANLLFNKLLKTKQEIDVQQQSFDQIKHQIQALMKEAERAIFQEGSVTWKKSKDSVSLDSKALLKLHPEMLQQFPQNKAGTRRFQIYTD